MMDITSLRKRLWKAYRANSNKGGWRAVAAQYNVSAAMIYRIANSSYEPKAAWARYHLGLPALAPAPVCPKCGQVHVTKRCTRRKPPKRWIDYSVDELRWAFENRVDFVL